MQGRDVFALPGNVDSPNSRGTNALILEGAQPITCAADIFDTYAEMSNGLVKKQLAQAAKRSDFHPSSAKSCGLGYAVNEVAPAPGAPEEKAAPAPKPPQIKEPSPPTVHKEAHRTEEPSALATLDPQTQAVYRALGDGDGKRVEALASTGIPVGNIMAALTMLEICGLVEQKPGGAYAKK